MGIKLGMIMGAKVGRRIISTTRRVVQITTTTTIKMLIRVLLMRGSRHFRHQSLFLEMKQLVDIFICNNDTMQENLKRQLFGLGCAFRLYVVLGQFRWAYIYVPRKGRQRLLDVYGMRVDIFGGSGDKMELFVLLSLCSEF